MRTPASVLSSFLAALLLSACTGGGTPLDTYLDRLARSLDESISPLQVTAPALPRGRELRIDLLPGSLDLLDMLSLADCRLNITIGKSNSSLGKLATASQRLLLELEFLHLAPQCIASLDPAEDAELITTLQDAVDSKLQQLPARIWNATLGGPEFRRFWQRPSRLEDYPANTGGEVPRALVRLEQLTSTWLGGDYHSGTDELEILLGEIRRGDGGALLQALARQQAALRGADPAVQARIDRPLCFGGNPSPEGEIVNTVVHKYFAGEVQAWSVRLERRRQSLMLPLTALESLLEPVSPPAYRDWRDQRDSLLAASRAAPRDHARLLAELLESCGLRPGSEPAKSGQAG